VIVHLTGRPCRRPVGEWDYTTPDLSRVNCSECQQSKKFGRLLAQKEPRS
jgi:hypothetical protein